jgi:hypothetical protein
MQELLDACADRPDVQHLASAALGIAARHGHVPCVSLLLARWGAALA